MLRSSQSVICDSVSLPMTSTRRAPAEHQAVGDDERVDEARARRVDVEGAAADAECLLHRGRRPRHEGVGGRGGEHEHVDVLAACARRVPVPGPRPRWPARRWCPRCGARGSRCAR